MNKTISTSLMSSPLPTDAEAPKRQRSLKWHRVYYLLAAFDVLIVLMGLLLSHQMMRIYDHSLEVNQTWVERLDQFGKLAQLAGNVNAPGNDVFDTHEVEAESLRMRAALLAFDNHLAAVEEELRLEIARERRHDIVVRADVERLPKYLGAIKTAMAEMVEEAELIFSHLRRNQPEMAGRRMATMDRKYAKVRAAQTELRAQVDAIQEKLFKEQVAEAAVLRKFEYSIAALVLLMVAGAILYGHKVKKQMESDAREKERNLEEVQRERANGRFRLLAEAIPQIVWTANPDGFLDYYNQQWFDYTGMTLEQTKGWGWQPVLHPDDVQRCVDVWASSVETGDTYEIEYRFKRAADGVYRWHLGRAVPVRDAEGQIVKWFGTCTDIEDHKRVEAELQKAREELEQRVALRTSELSSANNLLKEEMSEHSRVQDALDKAVLRERAMIENALDVICSIDAEGRFATISPACLKLWGYCPDELIGRRYIDLVAPEDVPRTNEAAAGVMSGKETINFENCYRHKDGSLVNVMWAAFWSDTEQLMFCVAHDNTERKRGEEALQDSRDYLDRVINAVADPIFVKDRQLRLVLVNDAMCHLMGREREQLWNTTGFEMLPEAETAIFREKDELVFASGEENVNEESLTDANGITRVIVTRKRLYVDKKGEQFIVGVSRDITAIKRVEEILKAGETVQRQLAERQSAILDALPAHICLLDNAGNILEVNNEWKQFALGNGYSGLDFGVGSNYVETCENATGGCAEGAKQAADICRAVLSGESSYLEMEYPCHSPNEERWFKLAVTPLHKEKSSGAVVMHINITERKRIETELEVTRDLALETARLKSEFLANMSHEIRTPMNGVIGMTGLLLDTELTEDQRDFAETIKTSGDGLLTIINDILDFSKIEAGKLNFETIDFDLRYVIEDTIGLLAQRAHDKNIELASLIYSDVQTALRGDAGRFRQVLTNLIGNALKFTERGEVVVRASLESETSTHATVRFAVSDTGIGISEAAARNLFQAFVQADGSTTRKYGGTGLGLAISKQLVELMGGQIGVTSEPGKGSTFWFTAQLEKQLVATAKCASVKGSLDGKHVLIVDDNATNRKILVHQTVSWGMIPVEAESGQRGLELLRAAAAQGKTFDLAILDLMMPEMDGFEVARAIKADASIAAVRLVMLTSYGARGHGEEAREAGVLGYLAKPVRQIHLFDCLTSVMGQISAATGGDAEPSLSADSSTLITKHSLSEAKSMSDKRILVAEDNIVNQKVALRQLVKLGYAADTVGNGREALEALRKHTYDLILMDCQMPEMDGYEATAAIRGGETDGRHIPIIAMTAHALEGERTKCLAAGMDDYISKPVKIEELERLLSNWLTVSSAPTEEAGMLGKSEKHDSPPVDMERLYLAMDDDPEELQEILEIYLGQMEDSLKKLSVAIALGDASEIDLIAHNCSGVSANCGMDAVVAPLRELERMGREGRLTGAAERDAEVKREFARIKIFLQEQLTQLA